uniref:Uncharacterized protein n=1 Tax=Timema poppense TaxID=170557 RepID=A0A7R9GZ00_TIMPO|nr:unnamed protein product [Timema poppensis]
MLGLPAVGPEEVDSSGAGELRSQIKENYIVKRGKGIVIDIKKTGYDCKREKNCFENTTGIEGVDCKGGEVVGLLYGRNEVNIWGFEQLRCEVVWYNRADMNLIQGLHLTCAGGVCLPARRSYIKLNEPVVTTQKSWVDAMILILSTRLQSLLSEQALRNLKRSHFRNRVIVLR